MDSFRSLNLPITKMTVPPLLFLTPLSNVFSSSSCRPCIFISCSCDHQTCHFHQLLASKLQERPQALAPTSPRAQSSCLYSRPNLHFLQHAVTPPPPRKTPRDILPRGASPGQSFLKMTPFDSPSTTVRQAPVSPLGPL